MSRLYTEHVGLERSRSRVGAPGSRATIRDYCSQVWHQARLWERIEKSLKVAEFTFPGDPMRIDYSYRRNGTRGFVRDTLRDAGIEPIPMEGFAVWVAKLKPMLQ